MWNVESEKWNYLNSAKLDEVIYEYPLGNLYKVILRQKPLYSVMEYSGNFDWQISAVT